MKDKEIRIGQGLDFHAFCTGDRIVLGGVSVPFNKGVKAHSDGDALLHAITDALLGALGKDDIGTWFPDTDEKWKGVDSSFLLQKVWKGTAADNWGIVNLDCNIITEEPKLRPHIKEIRQNISSILGIDPSKCSVKAKTAERLGALGRGEGIMTSCVVLLERIL